MTNTGTIGIVLIIANILFSYRGFTNTSFFESYKFRVDKILVNKDYIRLISAGFLHANWQHLIFNMITLYLFSSALENELGALQYLVIYTASLVGGGLFSLIVHRQHGDYSAIGASGAVAGIMFACIALFPGMHVQFFFIPIPIAGWFYGMLYMLYSIYGIRSKKDNIGHEAHLGGAVVGMLIALIMEPFAIAENYVTILIIAIPAIVFIVLIIKKPHVLLVNNLFFNHHSDHYSIDHQYNQQKAIQQKEIDTILDKINASGINSLSRREREKLDAYSKRN